MEGVFFLDEVHRATFLQSVMQSFGCTYVCIWLYWPQPSNCLLSLGGLHHEDNTQPSSSAGSLARRLFDEYRQLEFSVEDGLVPGLAFSYFKNNISFLKLENSQLQTLASAVVQKQFYVEARIKTSVFMGSANGEIELGFSNSINEADSIPMFMKNLVLPGELTPPVIITSRELQPPADQNPPTSSSSSLRSLSMDSPECSSLIFNIPTASHVTEAFVRDVHVSSSQPISSRTTSSHQLTMQAFAVRTRNIPFPTPETEDAAMTRAMLAVLSSPSSPSSSQQPPRGKSTAFKKYAADFGVAVAPRKAVGLAKQSVFKRSITFFRNLNLMRIRERMRATRPTTTQHLHMMSERKRREKLNESYQALRSLLPAGTKKDKASVLTSTREYLATLINQVAELRRKNQLLEAKLLPAKESQADQEEGASAADQRFSVRLSHVTAATEEGQILDLQIAVRGERPMIDIVIRVLEFLKQVKNINVVSMEANTPNSRSSSLTFRVSIEDGDFDESAFQEAVRRLVGDLALG